MDGEKLKPKKKSTAENASDSDRNSKSAAQKLQAKVERFKQSRKSHSETRIVDGVAINLPVNSEVPLSVQSSAVSVKSEPDLEKIQDKVRHREDSNQMSSLGLASSQALERGREKENWARVRRARGAPRASCAK